MKEGPYEIVASCASGRICGQARIFGDHDPLVPPAGSQSRRLEHRQGSGHGKSGRTGTTDLGVGQPVSPQDRWCWDWIAPHDCVSKRWVKASPTRRSETSNDSGWALTRSETFTSYADQRPVQRCEKKPLSRRILLRSGEPHTLPSLPLIWLNESIRALVAGIVASSHKAV